jgi:hypothetical protein
VSELVPMPASEWRELCDFRAYDAECVQPAGADVLVGIGSTEGAALATIVWCDDAINPLTGKYTVWLVHGPLARRPLIGLQRLLAVSLFIGWFTHGMQAVEADTTRQ